MKMATWGKLFFGIIVFCVVAVFAFLFFAITHH